MDNNFTTDVNKLYAQLRDLGNRARKIITEFAKRHGGNYTFDTENDDLIWLGAELFATALKIDGDGRVLVYNSAQYSEYLNNMEDCNVLDLADYLNNMDE